MGREGLEIMRMLFSLAMVLAAMAGTYFWFKRRGGMPGASQRRMRVIERLAIDSRRSLLLVRIDGEEMVVGVGNDGIRPIKTLEARGGDEA